MADEPLTPSHAPPSVTPIVRDPARLAEALPWYANGTLSADDRAWVEALLDEDPGAAGQLGFDRLVQAELTARLTEVPADIGWTGLLAKARADARGSPAAARPVRPRPAARTSWSSRLVDAIGQWMTPQWATALAALVLAQTVALGVLVGGREAGDTVEYRSGAGAAPVATLRVLLNERTTEAALRDALLAHRVTIIDGPNALGEYWLLAPQGDPEAVGRALAEAGVVATWALDHRPRVR